MKLDFWTKAKAPPKMGHNPPPSKEERMFILMMNDIFKRQVADAAKNVKKVLNGEKVELVDRSRWIPEIAELTEGLRFVPFKRGGDEAISDLYKVKKQFGLTEWIEDPAVLQAVREESFMFARTISDKTADDLQVAMMKGVKAGESITQIERRVVGVNEAWRDSKRSMMIARTETSRAYTQGQIAAWEQTGVVTEKVWSAASDSCPFCAVMNGKVVGLKEDYLHNGDVLSVSAGGDRTASMKMGYGNVNGPPLHPNCRCSIVAHVVIRGEPETVGQLKPIVPATPVPKPSVGTTKLPLEFPPVQTTEEFRKASAYISPQTTGYELSSGGGLSGQQFTAFKEFSTPEKLKKFVTFCKETESNHVMGVVGEQQFSELRRIVQNKKLVLNKDSTFFFGVGPDGVKIMNPKAGEVIQSFGARYSALSKNRALNYARVQSSNEGAEAAVFRIRAPKGTKAIQADVFDLPEAVFLPGNKMRVLKVTTEQVTKGGVTYPVKMIDVDLVDDGTDFLKTVFNASDVVDSALKKL